MTGCLVFEDDGRHQCECDVPQSACTGEQNILTEACACFPGCYGTLPLSLARLFADPPRRSARAPTRPEIDIER